MTLDDATLDCTAWKWTRSHTLGNSMLASQAEICAFHLEAVADLIASNCTCLGQAFKQHLAGFLNDDSFASQSLPKQESTFEKDRHWHWRHVCRINGPYGF